MLVPFNDWSDGIADANTNRSLAECFIVVALAIQNQL